jgi:hypothetical protein
MACQRKLATVPLPGDVACFLARKDVSEVLQRDEAAALSLQLAGPVLRLAAEPSVTSGATALDNFCDVGDICMYCGSAVDS